MEKLSMRTLFSSICVFCLCINIGCSSKVAFNQSEKSFSSLSPMTVARRQAPNPGKLTGGTAMFAAVGVSVAGSTVMEKCDLQDPGIYITNYIVEKAPTEIPGWPSMQKIEKAIDSSYAFRGYMLELNQIYWCFGTIGNCKGVGIETAARLKDDKGNVLWKDDYYYKSKDFGRVTDIELLESDKCRLLKEEVIYGADVIAKYYISSIKSD